MWKNKRFKPIKNCITYFILFHIYYHPIYSTVETAWQHYCQVAKLKKKYFFPSLPYKAQIWKCRIFLDWGQFFSWYLAGKPWRDLATVLYNLNLSILPFQRMNVFHHISSVTSWNFIFVKTIKSVLLLYH